MKNTKNWLVVGALAGLALVGCGGSTAGGSGSSGSSAASTSGAAGSSGSSGAAAGSTGGGASDTGGSSGGATTGVNAAGSGSAGSTGSSSGSTTGTWVVGPHEAFPTVPNNDFRNANGVLSAVQVVTVTYDNDPQRAAVEAYADWVVQSDWLATVGADYGVGKGTHFQKVHLAGNAPSTVQDSSIDSWVASKIADGTLPAPDTTLTQPLYVLYYPATTTITGQAGQSCQSYGGYHTNTTYNGRKIAYAVMPTCQTFHQTAADVLAYTEEAMSHELIEAATDPYPATGTTTYSIDDYNSPWAFIPGEVGDLCVGQRITLEGNTVQRIWSNSAAAAGGDPCIPVPAGQAYYNVSTTPANNTIFASAGSTITLTVQAWSTADVGTWFVQPQVYTGNFNPNPQLSRFQFSNNTSATLTMEVPPGTPSHSYVMVGLYSSKGGEQYNMWPVAVIVP